jgi:UDP-N-acetylglucosamine/UDP-N-acetylgalactosamine 4-epimerase
MLLTTVQFEKIASSAFLVTGGAGFIGSHIAEYLLNAGARRVRVLDNLSTGHFRNIAPFANHPRFEFIKGDICDIETCKAACRGMDYVLHQAAASSVPGSVKETAATNSVNVSGFLNMLVIAQAAGVRRFVYASGAPIYGDATQVQREEKGATHYPVNKYINELYADVFANLYGMETIGLRYFNVFGQRQDPQSEYAAVIPKLMMQLIRHQSPVLNEMDAYARDFIYIEDVVQANMLAVLTTDPKAVNQVYNITNEEITTLHQLALCLKEFLGLFDESIARIEIVDGAAANDPDKKQQQTQTIARTYELLGFQPRYSLRNGLLKSTSWYWAYLPQYELETRKLEITN